METKEIINSSEGLTSGAKRDTMEVGRIYPIFGMITKIVDETPGHVIAEINSSIRVRMNIPDDSRIEVLKERAFESGVFISKITSIEEGIEADCQTVIFGKRQSFNA